MTVHEPRRPRSGRRRGLLLITSVAVVLTVAGAITVPAVETAQAAPYVSLRTQAAAATTHGLHLAAAHDTRVAAEISSARAGLQKAIDDANPVFALAAGKADSTALAAALAYARSVVLSRNVDAGTLTSAASAAHTAQASVAKAATAYDAEQAAKAEAARIAALPYALPVVRATGNVQNQALIDSCPGGAIDLTGWYPTPTIAIHVHCGGAQVPKAAGTLIRITGLRAGLYRSSGIVRVLNADIATVDDVPRGYDLLFQTCHPTHTHTVFVGLTHIGD